MGTNQECPKNLRCLQAFGSSGGKSKVSKHLIKMIPEHRYYLEPFTGGAAVFFKKKPADVNVLNDTNKEIAHAYAFMANCTDKQLTDLKGREWQPIEKLFFELRDSEVPEDTVDRFYRFYYILTYSYGLNLKNWGHFKKVKNGILKRMPKLKNRLAEVHIHSADAIDILNMYNREDAFAYLDPPYPEEWAGPEGTGLYTKEDCEQLKHALVKFKGNFLMSMNKVEWIEEMFKEFNIYYFPVPRSFKGKRINKIELLISNYEIEGYEEEFNMATGVTTSAVTGGSGTSEDIENIDAFVEEVMEPTTEEVVEEVIEEVTEPTSEEIIKEMD